jgi:ketosteroid isomerase-like protein
MTADTEANKALVARHYAILNGGDPSEWDEIMAEDFVSHHPHAAGEGRDRYRNAAAPTRRSSPTSRPKYNE